MMQPEKNIYSFFYTSKLDYEGRKWNLEVYGSASKPLPTQEEKQLGGEIEFLIDNTFSSVDHNQMSLFINALLSGPYFRFDPARTSFNHSGFKIYSTSNNNQKFHFENSEKILSENIEKTDFGTVEILHETEDLGLYRLIIDPGKSIPCHVHYIMNECELVLNQGIYLQGQPALAGSARCWPKGFPHLYENKTTSPKAILCIDSPSFIASDEVLVSAQIEDLSDLDDSQISQYW